jgi:hypothetical protein
MAAPAKLLHVAALLAKTESTYGTAATLVASSDGVQMQFDQPNVAATFEIKYANDGDIGQSMSSLGQIARVAPAARYAEGTIPALMRLPGAAYSATVLPGLHRLVQAAGFDATVVTSAGTESVTYTPTAYGSGYTSLTLKAYERQEVQVLTGALCDLAVSAKDGKPPKWSFATKAIAALPGDASPVLPAGLVFPNSAVAPVPNVGITVTFGSYVTPVVKSWDFMLNRTINPRINYAASNAHAGFVPSERKPQLKLTIEGTALQTTPYHNASGFDPYSLLDVGTSLAPVSVLVGSTQYNKYALVLNQGQVIDVKRTGEGSSATYEITVEAYNSTATANDDLSIVCT